MPQSYFALGDAEARYSPHQIESTDDEYDDKNELEPWPTATVRGTLVFKRIALVGVFIIYTIVVFVVGYVSTTLGISRGKAVSDLSYLQEKYFPSLPQTYDKSITFNGTLDYPSEFRGAPSPDVDRAWNRSIDLGAVNVSLSDEDMKLLGVDPDTSVKLPLEDGGIYRLHFEFSHQLHCLNFLRMWTYRDYYQETQEEFSDTPAMQRMHIDHCIEMLRQFLMCHADTNLVSANWVAGREKPYPNFNTKHTCRDFDAIVDWAWDHQIPIKPSPKPVGVHELPLPP
ncbi:hypothetical protein BDV26DRAFT_290346 [Aspergillus bertholletiae]|uniref:Tat pathway signal sequence n=1 Tax=Aspergillus bertholletiae TaxID=1226010 RepID=A0A5N7BFB5_9EURO|nr:hypothetical protein BDV26DRAFT_290346 [Aspergillus bertholletiae]